MRNIRLYILGAIALLVLGGQLVLITARVAGTTEGQAGNFASQAQVVQPVPTAQLAQLTPYVPPANANSYQGYLLKGPNGSTPVAPPAPSDSDAFVTRTTGMPAIEPTIKDTGSAGPAFTPADVVKYRSTKGAKNVSGYSSSVPVSIVKIEFLTLKELKARDPYMTINLPDDTLLCYVQYRGSFEFENRAKPAMSSNNVPYAVEVFDARTGNLLVTGLNNSLK